MSSSEGLPRKPHTPAESTSADAYGSEFDRGLVESIPELHRYAGFLTNSTQEVEDLTQETLRKALEHKDSFQSGTNIHAWLRTIMQNTFTSQKRLSANKFAYRGDPEEIFDMLQTPSTQESTVAMKEALRFLEESGLSPSQKQAFNLHVIGNDPPEIAAQMKITTATAKTHLHRAIKKLSELRNTRTDPKG